MKIFPLIVFALVVLACGDDTATSPGDGTIDKASLIPGEYEGWAAVGYSERRVQNDGEDYYRWYEWGEEVSIIFTADKYAAVSHEPYRDTPDTLCMEGLSVYSPYTTHGDTLFLMAGSDAAADSACRAVQRTEGVYFYTVLDSTLVLELLGFFDDAEEGTYTLVSELPHPVGEYGDWKKVFYLYRRSGEMEGGDE